MELKAIKSEEKGGSIEDKRNNFLKIIFTPNRDQETRLNMYDPDIWKGFPLSDRFWYNICCRSPMCSDLNKGQFPIDEIINNPCVIDEKINLHNKCVVLKVLKTGTLEIEPLIVHPFVKVSFVNLKTGRYLQKANFDIPSNLLHEKNLIINHNKQQNTLEYKESNLDFLHPISTPPNDLRERGESFAEWNEEFIINDEASNIFNSNNIIFFELFDFNFMVDQKTNDKSINPNMIPIAWAFLRPVGYSQTYFGKFKLQLFKYKHSTTPRMQYLKQTNSAYLRTPQVLYEFNWIKKEKYQTFLEIELRCELKPSLSEMNNVFVQNMFRNSVFKPEGEFMDKELLLVKMRKDKKKIKYDEMDQMGYAKRKLLLKRKKGPSEDCILPDKLLFKFNTGKLGCLTHEFSNDGRLLAAACTEINSLTSIKIFNIEDGVLKYHLKGHQQLIHSLVWSKDSQILISGSSDNYVTLWQIPKEDSNNAENIDYMDNERIFKLCSIPHPSYVYSVAIFPDLSKDLMIFATACFDGIVRIYTLDLIFDEMNNKYNLIKYTMVRTISVFEEFEKTDFSKSRAEKFEKLKNTKGFKLDSEKASLLERTVLDHRHPNTLIFDDIGRLYIGDSLGSIHIWQVAINSGKLLVNKLQIVSHKELEGDNINKICIEPSDKKRIVVHSRDNCIRLLDISRDRPRVIVRYFGMKCSRSNIKSEISPDGQFVLSGSEEGTPYLWSLISGIHIPTEIYECKFLDALCDVSWNKEYNMFVLSGFGQEYPLLVYVHEKSEITVDPAEFKIKNKQKLKYEDEAQEISNKINKNLTPLNDNFSEFAKELKAVIEPQAQPYK
jgi:jouberin